MQIPITPFEIAHGRAHLHGGCKRRERRQPAQRRAVAAAAPERQQTGGRAERQAHTGHERVLQPKRRIRPLLRPVLRRQDQKRQRNAHRRRLRLRAAARHRDHGRSGGALSLHLGREYPGDAERRQKSQVFGVLIEHLEHVQSVIEQACCSQYDQFDRWRVGRRFQFVVVLFATT